MTNKQEQQWAKELQQAKNIVEQKHIPLGLHKKQTTEEMEHFRNKLMEAITKKDRQETEKYFKKIISTRAMQAVLKIKEKKAQKNPVVSDDDVLNLNQSILDEGFIAFFNQESSLGKIDFFELSNKSDSNRDNAKFSGDNAANRIAPITLADLATYGTNTTNLSGYESFDSVVIALEGTGAITSVNFGAIAHTPEPTTMLLFGSGLIALAGFRRKLKKN